MSTIDFKNYYLTGMILVLLFGVGLGYQISIWTNSPINDESATTEVITNPNAYPSESSPQAQPEIFVRTGRVESANPSTVTFSTYLQNSDGTYNKTVITATISSNTALTKINLKDTNAKAETITVDEISVGSEVAVGSAENMYGKTSINANTIQLHTY